MKDIKDTKKLLYLLFNLPLPLTSVTCRSDTCFATCF